MSYSVYKLQSSPQYKFGSGFSNHTATTTLFVQECSNDGNPVLGNINKVMEELQSDTGLAGVSGSIAYRARVDAALEQKVTSVWELHTPSTEFGRWLVRDITITPEANKKYAYRIEILETNMGRIYAPNTGASAGYFGDIDLVVNKVSTGKRQKVWRTGVTGPADTAVPAAF